MVDNFDLVMAAFFQLYIVISAIIILAGAIKQRPELRLWLMGEIILVISYIIIILYRMGFGEIYQLYDAILKFSAMFIAIMAVFLDFRRLYPKQARFQGEKRADISFAIAFVPFSFFSGVTLFACICLYLAIMNYKIKRTPTYAFMAFFMGVVIFTTVLYSLRFLGESPEVLQIWVTIGNITMSTTLFAFSIMARVEIDIVQSREMRNNLITFAAHELKTPLIPIFGWADLMKSAADKGLDLNKVMDPEDINSILRNAERLKLIVEHFLDVSLLESGRFRLEREPVKLSNLIGEAIKSISSIAASKSIQISQSFSDVALRVDSFRMQQVFINLLSNAIKYSPSNTTIQIHTNEGANQFEVIVQDQGCGFSKEELQDALKPFSLAFLRKKGTQPIPGTGVGLYICKNIVERHGGRVLIESNGENQGTTVRIVFPRKSGIKTGNRNGQ